MSRITNRVLDGLAEWQNRPLDRVYPVLFIDAIHVKIRDGGVVGSRPIYSGGRHGRRGTGHPGPVGGHRRRRGEVLAPRLDRDQEPGRGRRVHRRLRRPGGPARRDPGHVVPGADPNVCDPSAPQQLPLRQPQALAGHRQGPQADLHRSHRSSGVWLVGVDVEPGTYRTVGAVGNACRWERLSGPGGTMVASDSVFAGRATATVEVGDGAFTSDGCGQWRRLTSPASQASFGDGVWLVGVDVVPGTYRTVGAVGNACRWERLSGPGGTMTASDSVFAGHATATIVAADGAFSSEGCGEWRRL